MSIRTETDLSERLFDLADTMTDRGDLVSSLHARIDRRHRRARVVRGSALAATAALTIGGAAWLRSPSGKTGPLGQAGAGSVAGGLPACSSIPIPIPASGTKTVVAVDKATAVAIGGGTAAPEPVSTSATNRLVIIGEVTEVTANSLVVQIVKSTFRPPAETVTVPFTADTVFSAEGQPITVGDIKTGEIYEIEVVAAPGASPELATMPAATVMHIGLVLDPPTEKPIDGSVNTGGVPGSGTGTSTVFKGEMTVTATDAHSLTVSLDEPNAADTVVIDTTSTKFSVGGQACDGSDIAAGTRLGGLVAEAPGAAARLAAADIIARP